LEGIRGDVGTGSPPKCEEVLVSCTGSNEVALQRVGAGVAKTHNRRHPDWLNR
jgi:hypothetical protein